MSLIKDYSFIVCPDPHGTTNWTKTIKYKDDVDQIIFLGDYFDNRTISFQDQIANFMEIISFAKSNYRKVELLLGNHDLSYILDEQCSGYQSIHSLDIQLAFRKYRRLFLISSLWYNDEEPGPDEIPLIFSHAGVSKEWMRCAGIKDPIEIKTLYKTRPNFFRFVGPDSFGDNYNESPMWIRPQSLKNFCLPGVSQIVGHTEGEHPVLETFKRNDLTWDILFADTYNHNPVYVKFSKEREMTFQELSYL